MSRATLTWSAVVVLIVGTSAANADWLRFRGPNGSGVSNEEPAPPVKWSPTENVKWKTPLPGPGVSSPIVVGDKVFVTCYSGYGMDRGNPGNMADLKRHLVCLDRKSGSILWDKVVDADLPEDPFSGPGVPTHGYATNTPTSDGERVYVFFGKTGALAFDLDGKQLWHNDKLGKESDPMRWGSASSPIVYKNVLIVTASAESESLYGLDVKTGKQIWRAEAGGLSNTWSTPVLAKVGDDKTELVINVPSELWALDPIKGKFQWYASVARGDQTNASVVSGDGIVYSFAAAGRGGGGGGTAVKAGGKDELPASSTVWTNRDSNRFATPVLYKDRLYSITGSIATCIDAKTGKNIYEQRIPGESAGGGAGGRPPGGRRFGGGGMGGGDYSSPIIAGGKIYYVKNSGETLVLATGDKFELLATNPLTDDREDFMASPAVSHGCLFLRSKKNIYCIGK